MMILKKLILTVMILNTPLNIEVTRTQQERMMGMMYRQSWGNISGMLFIEPYPEQVGFWMKNTHLPMTIVYLDQDWNILEKHEGIPYSETVMYSKSSNVKYILELDHARTNIIFKNQKRFFKGLAQEVTKAGL